MNGLAFALILSAAGLADLEEPWKLEAPRTEVREHVSGVYWIEAENFVRYGGWLLDTQFAHRMGSGYLLAPGVGKPVAPAETRTSPITISTPCSVSLNFILTTQRRSMSIWVPTRR